MFTLPETKKNRNCDTSECQKSGFLVLGPDVWQVHEHTFFEMRISIDYPHGIEEREKTLPFGKVVGA